MGKRACAFKEADITRAYRAAKKAGVHVQITVDLEHTTMTLTPVKVGEAIGKTENEWDRVLPDGQDA
jgi:hypothetical protein